MRKIWNQYSYAITLIILSCCLALVLTVKLHPEAQDQYVKIKISEGDSLWKLSERYAAQHSLSNEEFVDWVKTHNKDLSEQIYPGEEILIPVNIKEAGETTELASAPLD